MIRGSYLSLGRDAHESLVVVGKGDVRGSGTLSLSVLDDSRVVALHDGDAGVGGTQVNANDLGELTTLDSLGCSECSNHFDINESETLLILISGRKLLYIR